MPEPNTQKNGNENSFSFIFALKCFFFYANDPQTDVKDSEWWLYSQWKVQKYQFKTKKIDKWPRENDSSNKRQKRFMSHIKHEIQKTKIFFHTYFLTPFLWYSNPFLSFITFKCMWHKITNQTLEMVHIILKNLNKSKTDSFLSEFYIIWNN